MKKLCFCFCIWISVIQSDQVSLISQIPWSDWEWDWIREIFQEVDYVEVIDGSFQEVRDRAVIITSHPEKLDSYLRKFEEQNFKFGIIHLSDEVYSHSTLCYERAAFVYRNYWHEKFLALPQVKCFGLGYKNGLSKNIGDRSAKETKNRKYTWSFAGQISKSTRMAMISEMKKIANYYIFEIQSFADPVSLSVEKYRDLLLDSVFVPCPRGFVNLDSFRVYEALECGCIPVVERDSLNYFTRFLGDHPFITVGSWDEAPYLIENLLNNPEELERKRSSCFNWWKEYKRNLQQEIAEVIKASF